MKNICIMAIITLVSTAYANQLISNNAMEDVEKRRKNWKGNIVGMAYASLDTPNEEYNPMGMLLNTYFALRLAYQTDLKFFLGTFKDLRGEREQQLADGYIALRRPFWNTEQWSLSADIRGYLPLNRIHRENNSFRGRTIMASTLTYKFKDMPGFAVSWRPSLSRSFYEYNTNNYRSVNKKFAVSNLFQAVWSGLYPFTFSGYFVSTQSWSMLNNRRPDAYEIGQEVGYMLKEQWSLSIGHINGGRTFDYNGADLDMDIFDRYDSQVYASLTHGF